MKKSEALYLSAREASAELAISPATLYAYVSRGLIRSEPSPDSRSHRYRAEDIRGLKERRVPSAGAARLKSFDPDLPVMDSAISTITEEGAIYRGVNCVDLAEKDTLEHTATLLWDVTGVDPFAPDNCPHVSDEMRAIAEAARRAAPIDRAIAVLALATSADPGAFTRAPDGRAMVGARILRLLVATMLNTDAVGRAAASADREGLGARQQARARPDPPRAGAAGRSRVERLDLHRALRGVDRPQSLRRRHRRPRRAERPEARRRRRAGLAAGEDADRPRSSSR